MPRKNSSSQNMVSIPAAVDSIKSAILQSQYMAASSSNKIQLALYFSVGRFVSQKTRYGHWGGNAIKQISERLQKELPGLRGFSERSIKYMRTFFEEWHPAEKESNSAIVIAELANLNEFNHFYGFDVISFTHHINILTGAKSREERLFYIDRCARNSWTVDFLKSEIKSDAFHHQGQMSNNFSSTLNSPQSALQAISMFKDEYLLDFMNVEEPSIGIVLCKNANKAFVEYVIQDYNHPMGVATYKLMQEKLQKVLPDENELKKLL